MYIIQNTFLYNPWLGKGEKGFIQSILVYMGLLKGFGSARERKGGKIIL